MDGEAEEEEGETTEEREGEGEGEVGGHQGDVEPGDESAEKTDE